jgi:hypothetical protein
MIIYNKEWLANLYVVNRVKADNHAGYISNDELKAVEQKYPVGFYMPGVMVCVGLFILTCIIAIVGTGLLSLMAYDARLVDKYGWPLFLGICCYIILEVLVRSKRYFHSGVDNALLYISAGLLCGGFIWFSGELHNDNEDFVSAIFVFVLCTLLTLRFADIVAAAFASISLYTVIFFGWERIEPFGAATMPFIIMLASAAVYIGTIQISRNLKKYYYGNCLIVVQIISLLTLYAAGNYLIVEQVRNDLQDVNELHNTVPLGWFFWMWTFVLPAVYISFGILKKNVILLRTGLVLVAAAVATFRNYYHILPAEVVLTLAGLILLVAAYSIIKYLKTPKHGFTYAEPDEANAFDKLNIEGLIIGEATTHLPPPAQGHAARFGGGSGGGGGSSGSF